MASPRRWEVVKTELLKLQTIPEKKHDIEKTLDFIKNFKKIPLSGSFADKELLEYTKSNQSIIGTMDKELKKQVKQAGGSILSFSNDKIILES